MQSVGTIIDRRLTMPRLRFAAMGVIGVAVVLLLAFSFATTKNNRTSNGLGLGSDYLAFYNAGTILNRYDSSRLYDLNLQSQLYHENLPGEAADTSLPFANAPFIAVLMRPLAMLPYSWSYAAWIGISIALFAGAFTLAWKAAGLPKQFLAVGMLLALSFEPFIIENLHGGQISTIGMFAICAAICLAQSSRPFAAGRMLALCIYKPTLLPIILPMLVITKQWRVIAGFVCGATTLAGISLATVGQTACIDYVHMLTGYAGKTATGAGGFQMTKFIDLNSFMKLLGVPSMMIWTVLVCAGALFTRTIWHAHPTGGRVAWAVAIAMTLVLNLYVGVYDAILIIPAILLVCGKLLNGSMNFNKLSIEFRMLLCAIWILPWISSLIARETGVQLFTIALITFAIYAIRMMLDRRSHGVSLTTILPMLHNAWCMKHAQRAATIASAGIILLYFAMIVRYQLSPGLLDHVEATVCCDAQLWLRGEPLYHLPSAPVRYSTIYGPDVFLFVATGIKVFGATIRAAKILPCLAAIASVYCTWLSVRKNIVITAFVVLGWMCFRHITYWVRPDPFELLCVSAALLGVTRANRTIAVITFALACGIAINLKVHAIIYFLPVAVLIVQRFGWKVLAVSILATLLPVGLPFAISGISLTNYLAWLSDAAHQGFTQPLILRSFLWFAIALLAMLCAPRFDWSTLGALLITAVFASKAGAGPHHFAPLFPIIAYGCSNTTWRSWRRCAALALACVLIGFAVPSISWTLRYEWWIDSMKLESELRALVVSNPNQKFHMGFGGDDKYRYLNTRPVLVFAGGPYSIDPVSVMDSTFAGRAIAPGTAESIFSQDDVAWVIPRDSDPFSITNQFDPSRQLVTESFREVFLSHFHKQSSTKHFDIWVSTQKHDSTDNRGG